MHCALLRSKTRIPKDAERESSFLSRKSLEKENFNCTSKDSEVSTVALRDSNQRCTILTFLAIEPDGQWKIVAVPLGHGSPVNHLGSATPGSSVNGHQSQNKGNGSKFFVSKEEKSRKRNSKKKLKKRESRTKSFQEKLAYLK